VKELRAANLAVRFVLELTALGVVAYWGYATGSGVGAWLLALACPVALALAWGVFVSPKARVPLPPLARFAVEIGFFAVAALALWSVGQPVWAIVLLVVAVVSGALDRSGP
jgi:hypothetical protein